MKLYTKRKMVFNCKKNKTKRFKFYLLLLIGFFISCQNIKNQESLIVGKWKIGKITTKNGQVVDGNNFAGETFTYLEDNKVIHSNSAIKVSDTGQWKVSNKILYQSDLNKTPTPFGLIKKIDEKEMEIIQITIPDSIKITFKKIQ
jgi:hypothetical protein